MKRTNAQLNGDVRKLKAELAALRERLASAEAGLIEQQREIAALKFKLSCAEKVVDAAEGVGPWLAAAMTDDRVCREYKRDIDSLLEAMHALRTHDAGRA